MPDRRTVMVGLGATCSLGACAATPEQQIASLTAGSSAVAARTRQSRRFDTEDRELMLRSSLGALQDLGFTIVETDATTGIIVGSKARGGELRAQISVRPLPDRASTLVRATFQRVVHRPGAMLPVGETIHDPLLYQQFFERVAQSAFLTAHDV